MQNRKRLSLLLAIALILSLVLSACSGGSSKGTTEPTGNDNSTTDNTPSKTEDPGPKIQGKLIYASSGDPVNFNPILQSDTTSGWVVDRVFSGLIDIDENLNVVGDIATEWSSSDDGLEWTFKLRDDVTFHDGKPVTAEDVAYTYNSIKDKGYTGPRSSNFQSLDRVEVIDPHTVKFILNEPFSPLLTSLGYGILPKHLYADKPVAEMKDNPANRKPIGSGPWKFGEWVTGQYIVLERNDDYYAEGPYIPEVRLTFVQDTNVQVAKLEAGEIDVMSLPSKDISRITTDYKDQFNFYNYQGLSFDYVAFNTTHPLLKDKAVRQAIAYAVNRQQIVDDILEGKAVVMSGPLPPASWAYEPNVTKYNYDPKKSQALLEEAGFTKGSDGVYQKDGQRLSFTLITNSGNTDRESMVLFIQKALKDVGIEIKTEFIEWSVFLEKYLWVGNFDMFLSGFSLGVDPDQFSMFHSSMAEKNEQGRFKGFNRAQFRNAEVDRVLEEGRREFDKEKRKAIYSEYQKLISEEIPWMYLTNRKSTTAIKPYIKGVVESPLGPTKSRVWYSDQP